MKDVKYCHRDCMNFAPIDVAKGICHITKKIVPADAEQCNAFERIAKCKYCQNFQADKEKVEIGVCTVSTHVPTFPAYPDMVATTCEMYKEAK